LFLKTPSLWSYSIILIAWYFISSMLKSNSNMYEESSCKKLSSCYKSVMTSIYCHYWWKIKNLFLNKISNVTIGIIHYLKTFPGELGFFFSYLKINTMIYNYANFWSRAFHFLQVFYSLLESHSLHSWPCWHSLWLCWGCRTFKWSLENFKIIGFIALNKINVCSLIRASKKNSLKVFY